MKSSPVDDYTAFEVAVKDNFRFLEQQYGFRLIQDGRVGYAKVIRYESPVVYINLMYGPPAYEPEMSFGRIGIDDVQGARSFHPGDLVLLSSSSGWTWPPPSPGRSKIVEIVSGHAQLLSECGAACLKGDQAAFEEMKVRRDSAVQTWRQEEKAKSVRKDAERAWRSKDYGVVVSLYESIEYALTETEKKRLEYAKKQFST